MLPLVVNDPSQPPFATRTQLETALRDGIGQWLRWPASSATGEGRIYAEESQPESGSNSTELRLSRFSIDLTGAAVLLPGPSSQLPAPPQLAPAAHGPAITAEAFELRAAPLLLGPAQLHLHLTGHAAKFRYAQDPNARWWLAPDAAEPLAGGGSLRMAISASDLRALLLEVGRPFAADKGVTLENIELDLQQQSPRELALRATITAKKMFLRAELIQQGRLLLHDDLSVELQDLHMQGNGFLGAMASSMAAPIIAQYSGRRFPLAAFDLGGLRLKEVNVMVQNGSLEIAAQAG